MKRIDELGDKLKALEAVESDRKADRDLPLVARLDGRSFHTFTRGFSRPYDSAMSTMMIETTRYLVQETKAVVGYTQSDEISLMWINPTPESQFMFDGRLQKLASVLSGMASSFFTMQCLQLKPGKTILYPHFDARLFTAPDLDTAADVFKWREIDATKNSITMAASAYYSHKQLHNIGSGGKIVMLKEKGIEWDDYPDFFKRGTYLRREVVEVTLAEDVLLAMPERHRPMGPVLRTKVLEYKIPPARKIKNLADVLFSGAVPLV
jgi:tRNA(His) guanylyltransferase